MRTLIFSFLFVLAIASQCMAGEKTVTYFLDGAKVAYETSFSNGHVEIRLPRGVVPDSVRIKPHSGANIDRVELNKTPKGPKAAKEIHSLMERKNLLQDRLKALETREEIFRTAAKSQSGRAPRKTKNNPEPMTNIRKGTEFAIGQLESVYAMRRKTEQELASLEARLSSLQGTKGADECICRVWFSTKRGRVHISYLVSDLSWQPVYDFRLNGDGHAEMVMRAVYASSRENTSVFVAPSKVFDVENNAVTPKAVSKPYGKIGEYTFPLENEALSRGSVNSLTFTFNNHTDQRFPAGYASCYRHGEYIGGFPFKGVGPKESVTLSFGKTAAQ
jgi:hypothetical protein